ncbi:Transposase [Pelotomaculum schinkii]|uniref:Transposase n=1 Tax=Pelotomaculum schinkii TaxID=78350 RepID=A0A4Y7RIK4_9FIRM|nr:site-specific integrase [Pelotomaculum schinkii]TEB08646.1 Transposase [Pelotomaculum schinkii]
MVKKSDQQKDKKKKAHKRGHGEGTIYQRPDGRWTAQATIGRDSEGKPKRVTYYGKTRPEVLEKLDKARAELKAGTFVANTKMSVSQWIATWLETYAKPRVRLSTFESYQALLTQHVTPVIGGIYLKDLRPEHLQKLVNQKLEYGRINKKGGLSARTVRYILALIGQVLKQALKEGLVNRNVADSVSKPKRKQHEIVPLTIDQTNSFLNAARDSRHFPAFLLEWATGLRRGELLGLRWKDVDLKKGAISVRQSLIRTKSQGLTFTEPKTKKSRRTIPIPQEALTELKAHKARQNQEKLLLGGETIDGVYVPNYKDNDLVFCRGDGLPMDPRGFTKAFDLILSKAGLPKVAFHDMRHGHATMLLLLGEHPKVVQERLGHSTITMTLDTYSHILPGLQEKASSKLSTVLDIKEKPSHQEG